MHEDFMLKLVKDVIQTWVKTKKPIVVGEYPEELNKERGVFISIYKTTGGFKHLRSTVGHAFPTKSVIRALVDYSIMSCKDASFTYLKPEDLDGIQIKISIAGEPELIDIRSPRDYLSRIQIGKDGLVLRKGIMTGDILPEIPVGNSWDVEKYLKHLCVKTGLASNAWTNLSAKIYKFDTETFSE
ncbi:MAG: TIGR00296 family protein [Candidatus Aenigmarchaeota archaeon]|nr:TIGR00296 family protein [Candidatus Aenigmarchaeota archaeon]